MESEPTFRRPLSYWRSVIVAVVLSVAGQGVLAIGISLSGSPVVAAIAAVVLATSGVLLIVAAAVRTGRSYVR